MDTRNIIVIGASAGGFNVLQQLVANLPSDLPAALFIVWHMSPDAEGLLPQILNRAHTLPAVHARDGEAITRGRIYVAPPDHHLLVEPGRVRVTKGPKEHRFRPAVDTLFRSAALAYGARTVGVVLSGALDDGTAGLQVIKQHGGTTVVQDPLDAEFPSMPQSALRAGAVDYVVPAAELAALLVHVSHLSTLPSVEVDVNDDDKTRIEIRIAAEENALEAGVMKLGLPTPYTCPDCHGVLLALQDGKQLRYRCHTGHAFSADSLLAALTATTEDQLWSAIRSLDENVMLLNYMGDHLAEAKHTKLAALYYQHATTAHRQTELVRQAMALHHQLSRERLQHEADMFEVKARENDEAS